MVILSQNSTRIQGQNEIRRNVYHTFELKGCRVENNSVRGRVLVKLPEWVVEDGGKCNPQKVGQEEEVNPGPDSKEQDYRNKDSNPQEDYLNKRRKKSMSFAKYQNPHKV